MINSERHDRLDAMLRDGRIVRGAWTKGHDRACLLAALSPEAGAAESASACPAEVMAPWLAYMTPWLDDATSAQAWPAIVARYAALARRWHTLDDAAWERTRIVSLIVIVAEARAHVAPEHAGVLAAIDGVLDWLRRGAPESEREAAWAAARAARAAARAARAAWAAGAAWAAAWPAAESAESARTAAWAAEEAAWEEEAADTKRAAADRITTGVLDAIEREIERMEAADLLRGAHLIDQGLRDLHRLVRVALTAAPDAERAGLVLGHTQVGRGR